MIDRYFQYGFMLSVFEYIYTNFRLISLPINWKTWIFAMMLMELMFYCAHRILHEVNFLWSSHQYHHSSKNFNVATAIRLSWLELNVIYVSILSLSHDSLIAVATLKFL